jgi:uncharacterized CHY-type Zn-finger protein
VIHIAFEENDMKFSKVICFDCENELEPFPSTEKKGVVRVGHCLHCEEERWKEEEETKADDSKMTVSKVICQECKRELSFASTSGMPGRETVRVISCYNCQSNAVRDSRIVGGKINLGALVNLLRDHGVIL